MGITPSRDERTIVVRLSQDIVYTINKDEDIISKTKTDQETGQTTHTAVVICNDRFDNYKTRYYVKWYDDQDYDQLIIAVKNIIDDLAYDIRGNTSPTYWKATLIKGHSNNPDYHYITTNLDDGVKKVRYDLTTDEKELDDRDGKFGKDVNMKDGTIDGEPDKDFHIMKREYNLLLDTLRRIVIQYKEQHSF